MERIEIINHKGWRILRMDFRGLSEDGDVISFIDEAKQYLLNLNEPTLQLSNVTGVYFTPDVMQHMSQAGKEVEHLIIKDAIVGIVGMKRILLQAYNLIIGGKAKAFDTEEEGKAWLIE